MGSIRIELQAIDGDDGYSMIGIIVAQPDGHRPETTLGSIGRVIVTVNLAHTQHASIPRDHWFQIAGCQSQMLQFGVDNDFGIHIHAPFPESNCVSLVFLMLFNIASSLNKRV
jgi:hypothetical protein